MKLYAPKYYTEFKCIADKCTHSCCIGWEIDIDEYTLEKYRTLTDGYGASICESIDISDTPHFILGEEERCPHLSKSGLCNIISSYGEEFLCDICREHPRFYNDTIHGREVGLGMACEEACRLILNSDCYDEFLEIEGAEEETESTAFDPTLERKFIYSVLKERSLPYEERLCAIYEKYGVSPSVIEDDEWHSVIESLEYLENGHKDMFLAYTSDVSNAKEYAVFLERALAYFIYRHCSEAVEYEDFRCCLGLCLFLERLLASVAKMAESIELCARIVSEEIEYSTENTEELKFIF